jgi:uncharacterized repeat protein (TIGR01451 family)
MGVAAYDLQGQKVFNKSYARLGQAPLVGDIDGDGKVEIIGSYESGGQNSTFIWKTARRVLPNTILWSQNLNNSAHDALVDNTSTLNIQKYTDKTSARVGETITYTIVVTNNDQVAYTNIGVADIVPTGSTYLSGSASDGGNLDNDTVRWTIASLASGQAKTLNFKVTINQQVSPPPKSPSASISL